MKCNVWLNTAWNRVISDIQTGVFQPQNERHIQCHLYHYSLLERPKGKERYKVITEYPIGSKKIDMVYWNRSPRILVEIKDTQRDKQKESEIRKNIAPDIEKMRHAKELAGQHCRKPYMIYVFRGAKRTRLNVDVDSVMRKLDQEYPDIRFLWYKC